MNRRRVRRLVQQLRPELLEIALAHPRFGPEISAVLGPVRRWTCPVCWRAVVSAKQPRGWLIVQPFTRVAACNHCKGLFK